MSIKGMGGVNGTSYDFMPFLFKIDLAGKWGHSEGKGARSLNFTNKIEWAIKVRWQDL